LVIIVSSSTKGAYSYRGGQIGRTDVILVS